MTEPTVPDARVNAERNIRTLAFLTLFVIGTDTFLTAPLLPLLRQETGVSIEASGWFVSAYAIGYALSALVSGPLSDRVDRRSVLLVGLSGFVVFTIACGIAWGFWPLVVARFLAGVAAAFVSPQIWASIPVLVRSSMIVRTMGFATAGLAIAQVVGIPLASFLSVFGWRVPFFMIGAFGIMLWVILFARFPSVRNPHPASGHPAAAYLRVLRSRPLALGLLGYLIFQTGNFCALSFIGSWFARDFGANQTVIGIAMVVIGLGNAAGALSGGRVAEWIGNRRMHIAGIVGVGLFYLLCALAINIWIAVLFLTLAMAFGGLVFPVLMAQLQGHAGPDRGTVSSLSNAAMYAGTTIGAIVGGPLLVGFRGFTGIGVFTMGAALIALLIYGASGAFRKPVGVNKS
ncbi:MFS transporter [Mycetocola saprophilus]|uniref:MFS transporter n=1 Tax=Mycetocola saprophilus TaxID=76636 RepID=UPI00069118B2|nr:MFS transporter [Mycetocola saprophilus]